MRLSSAQLEAVTQPARFARKIPSHRIRFLALSSSFYQRRNIKRVAGQMTLGPKPLPIQG